MLRNYSGSNKVVRNFINGIRVDIRKSVEKEALQG